MALSPHGQISKCLFFSMPGGNDSQARNSSLGFKGLNARIRFMAMYRQTKFNPADPLPFKLSRSKIEEFLRCPRCFYLDRKFGISKPSTPPLTLNNAVDALMKKEFDIYRRKKQPHPLMVKAKISAIPWTHSQLETWRDALRGGLQALEPNSNFLITGSLDDIWINAEDELIVVDYKATAKEETPNLDSGWQSSYKRQVEIYQWLLRQNNFTVNDTAYFVYANGRLDRPDFSGKLEFTLSLIPYSGDDSWIPGVLGYIREILSQNEIPPSAENCEYCLYRSKSLNF